MNPAYEYDATLKVPKAHPGYNAAAVACAGHIIKAEKFIMRPVRRFRTNLASVQQGSYSSSDGASVVYYSFEPKDAHGPYPAIIYYHGGGFAFPVQKAMMQNSAIFASRCTAKVFLPDYRYLPKVDCKGLLEDCYEMLRYVVEHASELNVDPDRIMLYGDSAGGCLAACVAIQNRKRDNYPLRGQMLIYPTCDCDTEKYDSINEYRNGAWGKLSNEATWEFYLEGCGNNKADYVPMLNDCTDLPEAYVEPLQMDVLRDEAIAYASRLKNAGVPVICNLISGAYHGYDTNLKSPLVQSVFDTRCNLISKWLAQ